VRNPLSLATHPRRDRLVIAGCILGVATIAWAYLVHLAGQMTGMADMTGMAAVPGSATPRLDVTQWLLTCAMWAVMMVGMMTPSAAPTLLLYAGTQARRPHRGALPVTVATFGLGYIAVWTTFSVLAATIQSFAHEAALMSATMRVVSPRLAGAILLLAGLYQWTPAKHACLTQCRSPLGFLMSRWRDGVTGAFEMGVRHGIYCLGCCWALMCVLFAVGVMNLAWVAGLAALDLLEKVGRAGMAIARIGGGAMILFGGFLAFGAR
jgi:predicted metal-binding membrane protein